MARIRADYVFGTVTNDPALLVGGTTLTSAELVRLPAVTAPDIAAITLHDAEAGTFEIVHVTAHTAASTSATVLRAQEGTTAQEWPAGTTWLHGLTVDDLEELAAAGGGGSGAFVGARVYATASQSVASGAWVPINFGNETFDTDGFHDNAVNNSRLTVPAGKAGKYRVKASASFAIHASGTRHISFMHNATTRYAPSNLPSAGGAFRTRPSTDDILTLAVGDYVHVEVYHDAGTSLEVGDTTSSGAAGETFFSIQYLGA